MRAGPAFNLLETLTTCSLEIAPPFYQTGAGRPARGRQCARRAGRSFLQAGDGIPFHLLPNVAQIEPVRGPDARRRNLPFANRPPDGIRAHANEGREFFDRQI